MCQPKPGPRCANHVGKARAKAHADLAAAQATLDRLAGDPAHDPAEYEKAQSAKWAAHRTIPALDTEWDETEPGQAELARQIDEARTRVHALTAERNRLDAQIPPGTVYVDGPGYDIDALNKHQQADPFTGQPYDPPRTYVEGPSPSAGTVIELRQAHRDLTELSRRSALGRLRRAAKTEALACEKAGDPVGSRLVQKHGPGTAWLQHSSVDPNGQAHIGPALAIGVEEEDSWEDEADGGARYRVSTGTVTVEQPISQTHDGNRHLVGAHPLADTDEAVVEAGPDGRVTRLVNADPDRWGDGDLTSDASAADYADMHGHQSLAAGLVDAPNVAITWTHPTVVRDEKGTPRVLRQTGVYTASISAAEARDRHDDDLAVGPPDRNTAPPARPCGPRPRARQPAGRRLNGRHRPE
jgi:hypothetical protein